MTSGSAPPERASTATAWRLSGSSGCGGTSPRPATGRAGAGAARARRPRPRRRQRRRGRRRRWSSPVSTTPGAGLFPAWDDDPMALTLERGARPCSTGAGGPGWPATSSRVPATAGSTTSCSRHPGVVVARRGDYEAMVARLASAGPSPAGLRGPPPRGRRRRRARRLDDHGPSGGRTARPITWRGMSACELADERIVWWREYYQDPVGLAPPPVADVARADGPRRSRPAEEAFRARVPGLARGQRPAHALPSGDTPRGLRRSTSTWERDALRRALGGRLVARGVRRARRVAWWSG